MPAPSELELTIPPHVPNVLDFGSTGVVWRLNDYVVVKVFCDPSQQQVKTETNFYSLISAEEPSCPHLLHAFFHTPQVLFLENMSGGSLERRLRRNQASSDLPVKVSKLENPKLMLRWALELSEGITWLEKHGLVHGDLRPPNLLLDGQDHLRVADFGCVTKSGGRSDGNTAPYSRVLGPEAGKEAGSFGTDGARTEQFAIGSIIYYITRGFEVYDDRDLGGRDHGPQVVQQLQNRIFPPLDSSNRLDTVIARCWNGTYASIQLLSECLQAFPEASMIGERSHETADVLVHIRNWCEEASGSAEIKRMISAISKC